MEGKYISIKVIVDRLMRNPLMADIELEAAIDYAIQFMELVGNSNLFINKSYDSKFSKYRCKLPDDFVSEINISVNGVPVRTSGDSNMQFANEQIDSSLKAQSLDITYSINKDFIFLSKEDGTINIVYNAINIDEEGFPMIQSDAKTTSALEAYIKLKHYTILFDMGKITAQSFTNAEQDYSWRVGQCDTNANRLSLGDAERIFTQMNTLIPRRREFYNRFKNTGTEQRLKRH